MKKFIIVIVLQAISVLGFSQSIKDEINECAREYLDLKLYESAIDEYSQLIVLFPSDSVVFFDRGYVKAFIKDYEGAFNDFAQAIAIDSTNVDNYHSRGMAYYETGKYDLAVADFSKALSYEWINADLHYFRALAYLALKEYAPAIADFELAIKIKTDLAAYAWTKMAFAKAQLNKNNEALANCNIGITIDTANAEAFFIKGYILGNLKNYDDALMNYYVGLQKLEQNINFFNYGIYANKHSICNKTILNSFIKRKKNAANGTSSLAIARLKGYLQNYEWALIDFYTLLTLNDQNDQLHYNIALTQMQLKKLDAAIENISKAINVNPKQPEYYLLRGNIMIENGNVELGKMDISKYRKMKNYFDNKL